MRREIARTKASKGSLPSLRIGVEDPDTKIAMGKSRTHDLKFLFFL